MGIFAFNPFLDLRCSTVLSKRCCGISSNLANLYPKKPLPAVAPLISSANSIVSVVGIKAFNKDAPAFSLISSIIPLF